jgi:hypothetical protein
VSRFVTIATTWDPVRAEVVKDILGQEGIAATIAGANHNALLGAAGAMIEIRVQVPEEQAVRASEIVSAMDDEDQVLVDDSDEARALESYEHAGPSGAALAGDGPYRAAPTRVRLERPRMKRVAAFLALVVTFGTGHFYAGAPLRGLALLAVEAFLVFYGTTHPGAMWALPIVIAADLVGSVTHIHRNRSETSRGDAVA